MTESPQYHNGKPILVILFKKGELHDYPLNMRVYRESYFDFFKIAERYFSIFVVRGVRLYRGRGTFDNGYRYAHGAFSRWRTPITARVVFDKDGERCLPDQGRDWTVVNHPRLARLLHRKERTHEVFHRYMKAMYRVYTRRGCLRALARLAGCMAVFKPVDQVGGRGVVIASKIMLLRKLRSYDGLIEEFIDTSGGIPGLTPSYHDLRVVILDGKIIETYIRVPKPGSLISNFARGGTCHYYPLSKIPRKVREIAARVDRDFVEFGHRVYSIDFGFEGDTPYIIEMNEQPGLPFREHGMANYRRWHRSLLAVLRKAAHN